MAARRLFGAVRTRFESWPPQLRIRPTRSANICSCHGTRKRRLGRRRSVAEPRRDAARARTSARPAATRRAAQAMARSTGRSPPSTSTRAAMRAVPARGRKPLEEILVEGSSYSSRPTSRTASTARASRHRSCELCGQGELWRGQPDEPDPRPHQRRARRPPPREPADRLPELRGDARHALRTQEPPRAARERDVPALRRELPPDATRAALLLTRMRTTCAASQPRRAEPRAAPRRAPAVRRSSCARSPTTSYCAVGRSYGVSDNAIRKWVRQYEREASARRRADGRHEPRALTREPAAQSKRKNVPTGSSLSALDLRHGGGERRRRRSRRWPR